MTKSSIVTLCPTGEIIRTYGIERANPGAGHCLAVPAKYMQFDNNLEELLAGTNRAKCSRCRNWICKLTLGQKICDTAGQLHRPKRGRKREIIPNVPHTIWWIWRYQRYLYIFINPVFACLSLSNWLAKNCWWKFTRKLNIKFQMTNALIKHT